MSRYDLDLWPLDLELLWWFGRHVFKLYAKFDQNLTICCRVIDDLAHYCREILEGVAFPRKDLRGAWTELHQTWWGHSRHTSIISAHRVCFRVEISYSIFKRSVLEFERRSEWGQISHILTPVKIRGGVGEISGSRFKALPRTEPGV